EALPFADGSFDVVVATGVLEYAALDRALDEIARVLRAGGLAVLSYPNRHAPYGLWKTRVFYRAVRAAKRLVGRGVAAAKGGSPLVSPERFRAALVDRGLVPTEVAHTAYLVVPSPLDTLLPRLAEQTARKLEGNRRLGGLIATQIVHA